MDSLFSDTSLHPIYEKLESGSRLGFEDGLTLYRSPDLIGVGKLANLVRERKFGRKTYFVRNLHLNYTNVCLNRCLFCAFSRNDVDEGAFTLDLRAAEAKIRSHLKEPISEVHIVGGLNPALPFSYYPDLLAMIKEIRPQVTLKAFTAVEIDHFSKITCSTVEHVLEELKKAGLAMMPGGGAEVLSDRVHRKLYPKKIGPDRWLEVVRIAHESGITTNATMLYGHIETLEERVTHLIKLRALQDKTGGFSAFIPLAFHAENTKVQRSKYAGAIDDLKNVAVARLLLDNIPHIKAYWVMITPSLSQLAMSFGADDLDGTITEEKITHMAGARTPKGLSREEILSLIRSAGFQPVERDAFYRPAAQGMREDISG